MSHAAIELKPGVPWSSTSELNRLLRQQGLCLAVAQASVFDEIARAIPLDRVDEDQLIRLLLEEQGIDNDNALVAWLNHKAWNHEDLRYFATKGHRLDLFKQTRFEQHVEQRFLERKLDLDQVSYSLIRVKEESLAQELYLRLADDGADFAELAASHSVGPEKSSGGRIGPVPLSQPHQAVAELLRVSRPGQLWPPFFLVNIWLIVRLDSHQPAHLDDDLRRTLRDELFEDWLQLRVDQLLAGKSPKPLPPESIRRTAKPSAANQE